MTANSIASNCCLIKSSGRRPNETRCLPRNEQAGAAGREDVLVEEHRRGVRRRSRLEALFRHFDNRRQLASYTGLAPTPWQSGSIDREQGV